jgi:adenylate cyclase
MSGLVDGILFLLRALQKHLYVPGDNDTVRKQKVVAMLAGITGMVCAIGLTIINLVIQLDRIALLYSVTALYMILVILALYYFPRHYVKLIFITAIFVTLNPWATHLISGGFQSGLNPAMWSLFGPFAAVILIGPRRAVIVIIVLIVCALSAGLLEPQVAGLVPELSDAIRVSIGLFNIITPALMIFISGLYLFHALENERKRADNLLLNILPEPIAARLKQGSTNIAEYHESITVLFADIVNFTRLSDGADPTTVVGYLNDLFSEFDDLADRYHLEKIKTIGDAYMVAGGLPASLTDHVAAVAAFAVDILRITKNFPTWDGEVVDLRIGIHTGPAVAGVIGHRKFIYDLWGDTVNIASRMESSGLNNSIQVTGEVRQQLAGRYCFEPRGPIAIKGKGTLMTYLLCLDEAGNPLPVNSLVDESVH